VALVDGVAERVLVDERLLAGPVVVVGRAEQDADPRLMSTRFVVTQLAVDRARPG
jgi:hypothetical protein